MAVAYSRQVTEDELELWYDTVLHATSAGIAGRAILRIVGEDTHWPTPARFNAVRRAVQADDEPTVLGLEAGPQTDEERANVARWIALCREVVENRDKRPHWHGGPEPCVVCGGINPNLGVERARRTERVRAASDGLLAIIDKRAGRKPRKRYDDLTHIPWNMGVLEPIHPERRA